MSANLYWEPTERKKHSLSVGAPSSFMETLDRAFGSRTPVLEECDIPTLKGMVAASQGEFRDRYQELIDAIEKYEEIEISAEY